MRIETALSDTFSNPKEWIHWRDKRSTKKQTQFLRDNKEVVGRKMTRGEASDKIKDIIKYNLSTWEDVYEELGFFDPWWYKD
jgi:hypothetical protein